MQERLMFAIHPIVLPNILIKTPSGQLTLFSDGPGGGCMGSWGHEEGGGRDADGDCAFEDEETALGTGTVQAVHVACYPG